MALSFVQHSTNNLRVHHYFFNKSYITTSSVRLHFSSACAARLSSGLRRTFGLAPPTPCSNLRSTRQYRRYSKVSFSDDAAAEDDFYTFKKFTEKAIDIVTLAKEEAKRSGYDLIGAEHVLLAIISEGTSIAADILTESMKIENVEEAREAVKTFTKKGSRFDANRIFKLSIDNARNLGHDYVDIEHILLALIPEDESDGTIVLDILKSFGVDITSARKEVLQQMDRKKMIMLEIYCTNLTELAKTKIRSGPVSEHTKEVAEQVIKTLCTPLNKNPCLIGESKVANAEIAREVAQQIACGKAPAEISGKQVIMLHVNRLEDCCQERWEELFQEIEEQRDGIILFIDDMQNLITTTGEQDRSVYLIDISRFQCISTASTKEDYVMNKFVMRNSLPIKVPVPSITESIFILRNLVSDKMCIPDEVLLASVYLSLKFDETRDKFFLDEAFDLIDDANSLVKRYKYYHEGAFEAAIRTIASLRYGVLVEEIAAMKDIVADVTLTYEVHDKFTTWMYFTKRLRDKLARSYDPTNFFEGERKSLVDSKVLSDLLDSVEDQIVRKDIEKHGNVVVDFDASDNSFVVHELIRERYL